MEIKLNFFAPTKPHERQREVLTALDGGDRFVLLRAGRKFRKTSLMISWLFEKAIETGLTCPYIAPSKVQAKNIVWDDHIQRILTMLREVGVKYKTNEVELSVSLPRGKIQLFGVENKEALRGISNWGAVGMDEYDDWTEDIYPLVIRPNLIPHRAPALVAGTPKGYRNLYHLEQEGIFRPFHFKTHDNPEIDPKELAELEEEYKSKGMGYYRQEILAQYEKPHGVVYEEWELDRQYVDFVYDPNLPLHLSFDFGVNDPTSVLFLQPNGNEIRLVDYYEASDANIEHFVQIIRSKNYVAPSFVAGDISGRARTLVTGKSPIDELSKHGIYVTTSTIPDIATQIRNTHRFMPRLYVSKTNPNCERFMQCLVNYRYPEVKSTNLNQSNESPIHDEFSHAMRAFEYYCWNLTEPKSQITNNPPRLSFEAHLQRKKEDRWAKQEGYIGYD